MYRPLSDLSILLPFMRPVQDKLRDEFEKKAITKTSFEDLQVMFQYVISNFLIADMQVFWKIQNMGLYCLLGF